MARAELETIARQWISLWCAPVDWMLFDRLHSDDFEDCSSAGRPTDKRGFAAGLRSLVDAFPDLHTVVEQVVIDEEAGRVAVAWSSTGTNRARFLGIGPTGRRIRTTGIEIIQVEAGRIVRRRGEWDLSAHRP